MQYQDHVPEPQPGTPEGDAFFQKWCDDRDVQRKSEAPTQEAQQTTDAAIVSAFIEEIRQACLEAGTELPLIAKAHQAGDKFLYTSRD